MPGAQDEGGFGRLGVDVEQALACAFRGSVDQQREDSSLRSSFIGWSPGP